MWSMGIQCWFTNCRKQKKSRKKCTEGLTDRVTCSVSFQFCTNCIRWTRRNRAPPDGEYEQRTGRPNTDCVQGHTPVRHLQHNCAPTSSHSPNHNNPLTSHHRKAFEELGKSLPLFPVLLHLYKQGNKKKKFHARSSSDERDSMEMEVAKEDMWTLTFINQMHVVVQAELVQSHDINNAELIQEDHRCTYSLSRALHRVRCQKRRTGLRRDQTFLLETQPASLLFRKEG